MSSRKELKERRRREREEAERRAEAQSRRRRQLRLYGGMVATAAALAGGAAIALLGGSKDEPKDVFAAKPEGLGERLLKARLKLGPDHFHPTVRVVANGEAIAIPDDIGAGEGGAHAPLHRHPGDEKLHAEGLKEGSFTLDQFMQVWGVPLSATRLGPYRADSRRTVSVFVKAKGQKRFREVRDIGGVALGDGDEVYVSYGTPAQSPITS